MEAKRSQKQNTARSGPYLLIVPILLVLLGALACSPGQGADSGQDAPADTVESDQPDQPAVQDDQPAAEEDQPAEEESAPPVGIDPCTILTPDDVAALFGEAAAEPTSYDESGTVFDCTYFPGEGATRFQTANLRVRVDPSAEESKMLYDIGKEAAASVTEVEDVSGLGEAAYFVPANGQLNVQQGVYWVIITASLEGKDVKAELVALAPTILSRLP